MESRCLRLDLLSIANPAELMTVAGSLVGSRGEWVAECSGVGYSGGKNSEKKFCDTREKCLAATRLAVGLAFRGVVA